MNPEKPRKNKGGRPRDPRITELEQKLNITRRRAAQLLKEEGTSDELRELRIKKLGLECERLEFELEKAREDLELVPISEVEKFVEGFVRWANVNLVLQAQASATELAGRKSEAEIYAFLRPLADEQLIVGVLGYMKDSRNAPDPRIIGFAERFIRERFSWWPLRPLADLEERVYQLLQLGKQQDAA